MAKSNDITEADRKLFRRSIGAVQNIRLDHVSLRIPRMPRSLTARRRADALAVITEMTSGSHPAYNIEASDRLFFKRPGIQDKLMDKLRRGHIAIERQLDLHGMTVRDARTAMGHFLAQCRQQKIRCARIIHGKGRGSQHRKPVIKNELNCWLQKHLEVLAFCSAAPLDGGTGAVYVLLKNSD